MTLRRYKISYLDGIQYRRKITGDKYYLLLFIITYFKYTALIDGWVITIHNDRFIPTRFVNQQYKQNSCCSSFPAFVVFNELSPNDDNSNNESNNPDRISTNNRSDISNQKLSSFENDIQKKLSVSKSRAISALSQPRNAKTEQSTSRTTSLSKEKDRKESQNLVRNSSHRNKDISVDRNNASDGSFQSNKRSRRSTRQKQRQEENDYHRKESLREKSKRNTIIQDTIQQKSNTTLQYSRNRVTTSQASNDDRDLQQQGAKANSQNNNNKYDPNRRKSNLPRVRVSYSSLLPPPDIATTMSNNSTIDRDVNPLVGGLSSWEEFLGASKTLDPEKEGRKSLSSSSRNSKSTIPPITKINKPELRDDTKISPSDSSPFGQLFSDDILPKKLVEDNVNDLIPSLLDDGEQQSGIGMSVLDTSARQHLLPSIEDLFPLDLSTSSEVSADTRSSSDNKNDSTRYDRKGDGSRGGDRRQYQSTNSTDEGSMLSAFALDGISPVSDLFYRSSQSQNQDDDIDDEDIDHDDEELPFSAEQSDAVTSDHNKIRIRRNMVQQSPPSQSQPGAQNNKQGGKFNSRNQQQQQQQHQSEENVGSSSKSQNGAPSLSGRGRKMVRRGMEMLVGGIPINADPPQRSLELFYDAQKYLAQDGTLSDWASVVSINTRDFGPIWHAGSINKLSLQERALYCEYFCDSCIKWDVCPTDFRNIIKTNKLQRVSDISKTSESSKTDSSSEVVTSSEAPKAMYGSSPDKIQRTESRVKGKGFSKNVVTNRKSRASDELIEEFYQTKGEFSIEFAISKEELESGDGDANGEIVKSLFARAFKSVLERAVHVTKQGEEHEDFVVEIPSLVLSETEDGYTAVTAEFKVEPAFTSDLADMERRAKRIGSVFTQAMDDGDIAVAIAAAAKDETRWPVSVRNRVIEECLFQDDDGDEPLGDKDLFSTDTESYEDDENVDTATNQPNLANRAASPTVELFHGAGIDGVFPDYSASNVRNAPYSGTIGLRLVDAATERAKQRQPRVIAIGDVHGCIDELQDLLRQCDYCPGDLVVLLGDLVCKGPDSISVVQMAREIGAIGVRGNHDFEVIRWHQAIKSGVDAPVVGSEHFHIASCLSKADMKWMYSLPWYISSKDLGCLFVHAGFVSGIRLAKQNPRLMMNMRSILPDGTVTSKFFNNWPWARLWDGPQTVLFGHDADRGLQQYEHALGLDTGCVYGGRLTACILPEKRLVSVSARKEYFKYRRKHYD